MRVKHGSFPVRVDRIEQVTPLIKTFRLVDPDAAPLPAFSGGSHVIVLIERDGKTFRNPYSLMSSPFDLRSYEIAVRRADKGRGGSRAMHDQVRVGAVLQITYPVNAFPLEQLASKHVLVAGGVGITPILGHVRELEVGSVPFEVHYAVRGRLHAALAERIGTQTRGSVYLYLEDEGKRVPFDSVLTRQPLGTHVYVCGPEGMLDSALRASRRAGWPESHIHFEIFDQQTSGAPFNVTFKKSGRLVNVPPELSLLEAAEAAGISIPYLCRGGACGYCETEVVECDGEILHRDIWLSAEERKSNKKIMPCVSRAACSVMVLDR